MCILLRKGVQKYPGGTRQRWEIITSFMNQQLCPHELFTKEECLHQYQNLRSNKGGKLSVPCRPNHLQSTTAPLINANSNDSTSKSENDADKSEEEWSMEQQKQLEHGLLTYPSSCGMSQSDRWKAIAELVEVN